MLTPDMLQWSLEATIGIKFSKQFSLSKQAQKVQGKNLMVIDDEGNESTETSHPSSDGSGDVGVNPNDGSME